MVTHTELLFALDKTRKKHPHVCSDMARQFLNTIETALAINRENHIYKEFGELIRESLNEHDIRDNRKAYAALAGHFFGRRGRYKKRSGGSRALLTYPAQLETTTEKDGQIAFKI